MGSQNLSNSFVEEDLFGDYSFSGMQDSFNVTTNENGIDVICQELKTIFINKLPSVALCDVENKVFKSELTRLRSSCDTILTQITDIIQNNCSVNIINELNTLLQYFMDLLLCLQKAVQIVDKKIKLEFVESLPITVCEVLNLIFNHCKESDKIYNGYFEKLSSPLTALFKRANEVQSIFLNTLNNRVMFDIKDINETSILTNVANLLTRIGIVVTNLDIKTSAELWKQLIVLIENYTEILLSRLDVSIVINFLIDEILEGINLILKLEKENDTKGIEKNLKIASFNLKIIIKLCGIYNHNIGNCHEKILELLVTLNRYSVPCLQVMGFNLKIAESFQSYLITGTAPLIGLMIEDRQFIQLYFKKAPEYYNNSDKKLGIIYLSVSLILKLISAGSDVRRQWLRNEIACNIICTVLSTLQYCHYEFMLNLSNSVQSPPGEPTRKTSLFEFLMLPTAALVISLNCEQFSFIEKELLDCILQTDFWKAVFAIDVWSIAARYSTADLCYNQLNTLLNIYEKTHKFPDRPENVYLTQMLANLFSFLNSKYQLDIIKKYQINTHPKIWKILKLLHYTNLQYDFKKDVNLLLTLTNQIIENFLKESYTLEDYCNMSDFLMLLADCPNFDSNDILKNFVNNVTQLWQLNSNNDISQTNWYLRFTKIRSEITINILKYCNPSQKLQILNSLNKFQKYPPGYKIIIANVLKELSNITIEETTEKNVMLKIIENLFQCILNDENPIVKQKALETFDYFAHHTSHVELLHSIVENNENLQEEVSNYLQRIVKKTGSSSEYWKHQNSLVFSHKCDILCIIEPQKKKVKLSSNLNIDSILQRCCLDTENIVEFYKVNKMADNHKKQLLGIVNKINELM